MRLKGNPLPERRKRMSESSQDQISTPSRYLGTIADKMYRGRHVSELSTTENPDSIEPDSVSEDSPEIYQRVDHVLDGLQSLLPPGIPQFGILAEIMRGMRRDISLVPEEQVQVFMRSIGEACVWIADGSMSDLTETEDAGIRSDNSEEG